MKQLIYLALVIVCGAALLKWVSKRPVPTGGGWKTLTPEEAKARLDSGDAVTLLDVRTEAEYEESHIPGAVCLPVESIGTQPPASLPDGDPGLLPLRPPQRPGRRETGEAGVHQRLRLRRYFELALRDYHRLNIPQQKRPGRLAGALWVVFRPGHWVSSTRFRSVMKLGTL